MTTEKQEPQPQANGQQDLKVVIAMRGEFITIGFQKPLCDPRVYVHPATALELVGDLLRADWEQTNAEWAEAPQFPKYDRPAPPPAAPRPPRPTRATQQRPAPAPQTEQSLRLF